MLEKWWSESMYQVRSVIKSFWHRSLVFSLFYQKHQFSPLFEGFTSDRCLFCLEVLERWRCRQIERWTSVVELSPWVEVKQNKPTINTTTVSSCFSRKTIRAEQQNSISPCQAICCILKAYSMPLNEKHTEAEMEKYPPEWV